MLNVITQIVSLGDGRMAIYLPKDLTNDSAFDFVVKDRVKVSLMGHGKMLVSKEVP